MTGVHNSHFETLLGLCLEMCSDLSVTLDSVRKTLPAGHPFKNRNHAALLNKDGSTIKRRFQHEGVQYITTTLPRLGKWLDSILNSGVLHPRPEGFAPYDGEYPLFLHSVWELLWFYLSSDLTECPGFEEQFLRVLKQTRTLLFCFYKLEVPSSVSQNDDAIARFVQTDEACEVPWSALTQGVVESARNLLREVLTGFDPYDIYPKHGPGAVATGEKQEKKWTFSHFYQTLHSAFPYYKYMFGVRENGRAIHLASEVREYRSMHKGYDPTSKVVLVPKDSRGPRTICSEPLEIQYIQQGVARELVSHIETHPFTAGHVNFRDQSVNAHLARTSSLDLRYATLDLKDASDLVSLELFKAVWPEELQPAFLAARSSHAKLPNQEVIPLKKYAPMGSALCFPVESLIFWAICVSGLRQLSSVPFPEARHHVFVFGDDIIVPTESARDVIKALECCGLTVNTSKCCFESNFRESCGVDAYKGVDITPQRVRKFPGQSPSDALAHIAWLAYSTQLFAAEMPRSSMYCKQVVERCLGDIPITVRPEAYLSVVIPDLAWCHSDYPTQKWDRDLQSFTAKLWVVSNKKRPIVIDPWKRLNRDLLDPAKDCNADEVVVPNATKITKRRTIVYAESVACYPFNPQS